jgi:hypothetical protein
VHDRKDERGAVALFVALILSVLMGITAIVIDLGMQRVTGADLQAVADVVALDLAREIRSGRTQADLAPEGDTSSASSAVSKSLARNDDLLGEGLLVEVDWGSYDDGIWDTSTDPPSAVEVTASADTDYAVTDGSGDVSRTAYAVASSSACYRLGTFVTAIKSGDSTVLEPLNYMFGANLTLASYQGLANADVTLADLAATSVIGSPTQLLTGTISYSDILRAMIEALQKEGGSSNSVAISALQTILSVSGTVGSIKLSDVLHVSPSDIAALNITLNVLDIVGAARLATGEHFLEIDNFQAGVPGVGYQFTGGIALISAAELACGEPNSPEAVADNAQLEGQLDVEFVNLPSINVPGVGTLQTSKGTGSLVVDIANGIGQLVAPPEVYCGDGTNGNPHTFSVSITTDLASLTVRVNLEITGEVKVSNLLDLGLGGLLSSVLDLPYPNKVDLHADVQLDVGIPFEDGSTSTVNLSIPPNDTTPMSTGSSVYLNPANVVPTAHLKLGGKSIPDNSVLSNLIEHELIAASNGFLNKTLVPLIDNFNTVMIGPVARMVGLRFGGADVYAVGAVCGQPSLWG